MFISGSLGTGGSQLETRKALLLIDLQNDFVDPGGKLFVPNTAGFLPNLPSLIRLFRSKGDVFFVNTVYVEPRSIYSDATGGYGLILKSNLASRQPSMPTEDVEGKNEESARTPPAEASHVIAGGILNKDVEAFLTPPYNSQASWSQCCVAGSAGSSMPDLLSSAIVSTSDRVVVKSHYSPFQNASFLLHLRMLLVTELYICGSLSNISVYSTAIDAVSHGMSVTVVEDCVGYRDESCHREAMRQMADQMGVNGIDYQELMDDLAGLLGDVIHEEDFKTRHNVAFQQVLQDRDDPDSKQKTSAWLSSLEESNSEASDPTTNFNETLFQHSAPRAELSRTSRRGTAPSPPGGLQRRSSPDSPPRKRQSDDLEADTREAKLPNTRRCASHEGTRSEKSRVKQRSHHHRPPPNDPPQSPITQNQARPKIESKSTGDIPRISNAMSASESNNGPKLPKETESETALGQRNLGTTSRRGKHSSARRVINQESRQPDELIAADSSIIYDVLPDELSSTIFERLYEEVSWQKMYHRSGEVPRLVSVQGECSSTKVPIYRHPADSSPPLRHLTESVDEIRKAAEKHVGHPLNHVLIQLYRTPEDNISEHSDKTLDIAQGSMIVNYSAGALRTMILRSKRSVMSALDVDNTTGAPSTAHLSPGPPRPSIRVPLPHNSLFVLGPETNQTHLHSIRADKRPSSIKSEEERAYNGARISLTFRQISTFINPEEKKIWGQGATEKIESRAASILEGRDAEKEYESMIRAFGQENHQASSWNRETWYGRGFNVVDCPLNEEETVSSRTVAGVEKNE